MTSEKKPARPIRAYVAFRLAPTGLTWVDQLACDFHTTRSHVIRVCIAIAKRHESDVKKALENL